MLTPREIDALVAALVERSRPDKVFLFGSYAKGTATLRSDLDLLLVKDTPLPMANRADDLAPLLGQSLIPVDVHVYTPEEVDAFACEELSFIASVLTFGQQLFPR